MTPRWDAKVDENQKEIIEALRKVGASVVSLHRVGQGVPDLLVGKNGINILFEVKMPGAELTQKERFFHQGWRGQAQIVTTPESAVLFMEYVCR